MPYKDPMDYVLDGLTDEIRSDVLADRLDCVRETIESLIDFSKTSEEELCHKFRHYVPPGADDDWWDWADVQYDERRIASALSAGLASSYGLGGGDG